MSLKDYGKDFFIYWLNRSPEVIGTLEVINGINALSQKPANYTDGFSDLAISAALFAIGFKNHKRGTGFFSKYLERPNISEKEREGR